MRRQNLSTSSSRLAVLLLLGQPSWKPLEPPWRVSTYRGVGMDCGVTRPPPPLAHSSLEIMF